MENTTTKIVKKTIEAYGVNQAFVGLGLKETDASTLKYLNFFATRIPISAGYFMHVLPKYNLLTALYEKETQMLISDYTIDKDRKDQMKEEVKSKLDNWDDVFIEYDVKEGDPLEEMTSFTGILKADLLVIGQTRGASPHGILAKNLTRSTSVNALVIPQDAKTTINTILVPIDFSETSARAMEMAIGVHKRLDQTAKIICLYIYDMPNNNFFRNEIPWIGIKETVEKNLKDSFDAFLEPIAGDYKNKIKVALVERQTTGTANFIMDFANENGVDFMVMGARGHSKVHLLLMGSVTESVLDLNDHIPTMIIR